MAPDKYRYPPLVPRWKSVLNALRMVQNPIPILSDNVRRYGKSYTFHMGGVQKGIVTTEPAFIQYVLQKNHRNYRKSKMQTHILGRYVGQGLLTSDGAFWLRQRRLIQPAFHRDRLTRISEIMSEETDRFFTEQWSRPGQRDIYREMHTLAFRIVAKALFDADMDRQTLQTLSDQITTVQRFVVRRIRQPYLHRWFQLSGQMRHHDRVSDHSRSILAQIIRDRKQKGPGANDLLDLLLSTRYEDTGEPMDDKQVLEESLILFIAGHETSANALTWTLYLLATHPEYLEEIRQEAQEPPQSMDEAFRLPMTRMVIEESMRLYPPAWIIDRLSNSDDAVCGYSYPENTFVIQYIYGVHRDPDLWPEPEKFDPRRFSKDNKKTHVPFSHLPFGGGPRLCIGNQFAMLEMIIVLNYIARHYDFTLITGKPQVQPLVTLRPKGGLLMNVVSRK